MANRKKRKAPAAGRENKRQAADKGPEKGGEKKIISHGLTAEELHAHYAQFAHEPRSRRGW